VDELEWRIKSLFTSFLMKKAIFCFPLNTASTVSPPAIVSIATGVSDSRALIIVFLILKKK